MLDALSVYTSGYWPRLKFRNRYREGERWYRTCVLETGVQMTHTPVAVPHSAGLALAQVEEVVVRLHKRRAGSVFPPAAHFTRVLRFWGGGRRRCQTLHFT